MRFYFVIMPYKIHQNTGIAKILELKLSEALIQRKRLLMALKLHM
jgi:hypothetical protein